MNILQTKRKEITYVQIYLTNDEIENKETKEKINSIKGKNVRVAMFISGENNYKKILERIILSEVEKNNIL